LKREERILILTDEEKKRLAFPFYEAARKKAHSLFVMMPPNKYMDKNLLILWEEY
jgi:hypothetical protein